MKRLTAEALGNYIEYLQHERHSFGYHVLGSPRVGLRSPGRAERALRVHAKSKYFILKACCAVRSVVSMYLLIGYAHARRQRKPTASENTKKAAQRLIRFCVMMT